MTERAGTRPLSLRWRLLVATLVGLATALALAGVLLASLFRQEVLRQFSATLTAQLDQVTARLEFEADGRPRLDPQTLSDPRWLRPYSGLYWQVDFAPAPGSGAARQRAVLRSRSLWDAELAAPDDVTPDGDVHVHEVVGPDGARLLLVERAVRATGTTVRWRLLVAGDLRESEAAAARFNRVLVLSLAGLLGLLGLAAVAQVTVGLAPLRALQRALAALHAGTSPRLAGRFPAEVQPLVDDFNAVIDRHAEGVARARAQAGNLAHAIKTPLAAMAQAAADARRRPDGAAELATLVQEQVALARRHVDWHLARARAAGAQGVPGLRTPVAPVVAGLVRVMERVHGDRGVRLVGESIDPKLAFAGESQDLHEMLGNLLDNAFKWARRTVAVETAVEGGGARLRIAIEDDGPGIPAAQLESLPARGVRLDESVPGSGLGLAIVQELAGLYGGRLALGAAARGGLRTTLTLPAAALPA